jgi:hypothetical protein
MRRLFVMQSNVDIARSRTSARMEAKEAEATAVWIVHCSNNKEVCKHTLPTYYSFSGRHLCCATPRQLFHPPLYVLGGAVFV